MLKSVDGLKMLGKLLKGTTNPVFAVHVSSLCPQRALCSVATAIAARGMSTFSTAKSILFRRHAALLVTNSALCLMSGLVSGI